MIETSQDFRILWLSVIRRAQDEADGKYTHWDENPGRVIRAARKWLTKRSKGFCEVCGYAGLSPDQVERLVEDMRRKYGMG